MPENPSYQKWVSRIRVPTADEAPEQVKKRARFYRGFVLGFVGSRGSDQKDVSTELIP